MKRFLLVIRPENTEESNNFYRNAIRWFGGEVVEVFDNAEFDEVYDKLTMIEGILLPGGDDVGRLDYLLIKYAIENRMKMLGICQGMQSMAMYGSLDELISTPEQSHYLKSDYCHEVVIDELSKFYEIVQMKRFLVNSYHHQTIERSNYFKVAGKSSDGLIEAIESQDGLQIGVQWHPERMLSYDEIAKRIIRNFIES